MPFELEESLAQFAISLSIASFASFVGHLSDYWKISIRCRNWVSIISMSSVPLHASLFFPVTIRLHLFLLNMNVSILVKLIVFVTDF